MDFLRLELATYDLLDVMDDSTPQPSNLTPGMEEKRNILARDLIINKLDRHYYNKVCDIKNCKDIIKKIIESKSIETVRCREREPLLKKFFQILFQT